MRGWRGAVTAETSAPLFRKPLALYMSQAVYRQPQTICVLPAGGSWLARDRLMALGGAYSAIAARKTPTQSVTQKVTKAAKKGLKTQDVFWQLSVKQHAIPTRDYKKPYLTAKRNYPAMKRLLFLACLAAFTMSYAGNYLHHTFGTSTGAKNCTACKNCKYCKHCAKEGKSCGVCKKG